MNCPTCDTPMVATEIEVSPKDPRGGKPDGTAEPGLFDTDAELVKVWWHHCEEKGHFSYYSRDREPSPRRQPA